MLLNPGIDEEKLNENIYIQEQGNKVHYWFN